MRIMIAGGIAEGQYASRTDSLVAALIRHANGVIRPDVLAVTGRVAWPESLAEEPEMMLIRDEGDASAPFRVAPDWHAASGVGSLSDPPFRYQVIDFLDDGTREMTNGELPLPADFF